MALEEAALEVSGTGPLEVTKTFAYASWVRVRLPQADAACLAGLKSFIRGAQTRWFGGRLSLEKKEVVFHFLFGPGEVEIALETKGGEKVSKKAQVAAERYGFVELEVEICKPSAVGTAGAAQSN
jgi:hypothetical protein